MAIMFKGTNLLAQSADSANTRLTIGLDIRPRVEFTTNYKMLPGSTTGQTYYFTQRNRINLAYQDSIILAKASLQEIHVWANQGLQSSVGSINAFELYIEPKINRSFSVRIGRQELALDNGRLYSAAPWSQQSRSHEGLRFFYQGKIRTDLTLAFTRKYSTRYESLYSPIAALPYKFLILHQLIAPLSRTFTLTTINTIDIFRSEHAAETNFARATLGGRVDYKSRKTDATLGAWLQFGKNGQGNTVSAFYLQPEISRQIRKYTFRLGAEILSGENTFQSNPTTHSFVPLYGVTWKFMGNMNFFTRFPADVKNSGLINPYLFILYKISPKLLLRTDAHLFFSQYALKNYNDQEASRWLGFENDLSMKYTPNRSIELNLGFSYLLAGKSMELLGRIKSAAHVPVWSYLMISWHPTLWEIKNRHPVDPGGGIRESQKDN